MAFEAFHIRSLQSILAYRLDGSLFNLRRLKAETKVSNDRIYKLQYADDAAIPAHSAADRQSSLDILSTAYRRAGLLVNTKKTEVLSSVVTHDLPALSFSGRHASKVKILFKIKKATL